MNRFVPSALLGSIAAAAALLASPAAHAFDATKASPEAVEALTGGAPMVIVEEHQGGGLKLVTGGTFIDAPPETVWGVITDYTSYPEGMPEVKEVTVDPVQAKVKDVHYRLLFKLSIISKKIDYTLRKIETPPRRIEWELTEGDFDHAIGSWQLVPARGGQATLVYYSTFNNLKSMGRLVRGLLDEQPALEMAIQVSTAVTVVGGIEF